MRQFSCKRGAKNVKTYRTRLLYFAICCRKREENRRGSTVRSFNHGNWLRGSTVKAFSGREAITGRSSTILSGP